MELTKSIFGFFFVSFSFTLSTVLVWFYAERKLSAFFQDRFGPLHVGKAGILQPFADLIKLAQKETILPNQVRKGLFVLAPMLVFVSVFSGFALIPLVPSLGFLPNIPGGLLLLFGLISIEGLAIVMAAYNSKSQFPLLGAGRAVAQMISYEIPLAVSFLSLLWITGSADLSTIESQQSQTSVSRSLLSWPFLMAGNPQIEWGGFFTWNVFRYPLFWALLPGFFISIMAESNRAPFDIPEGESEIIGGFHTEYSGFLWAIFFLAEYAMMLILSLVLVFLFLGGKASPIPHFGFETMLSTPHFLWLVFKTWFIGLIMIWIRWTLPRLRADQLMALSWKVLTPASLFILLLVILLK